MEKMQIYCSRQFSVEDPYEITQFLRGELYILIDFCLSKTQHNCEPNSIRTLFELYVGFFNDYIDVFQNNLKEVKLQKYNYLNYFLFFI